MSKEESVWEKPASTQPQAVCAFFKNNFSFFNLSLASGLGGALSGVVQDLQSERIAGRHRQVVPATSCLDHAHSPALRRQPDGRQREHGSPLQRVAFKLPSGQTAAGYR